MTDTIILTSEEAERWNEATERHEGNYRAGPATWTGTWTPPEQPARTNSPLYVKWQGKTYADAPTSGCLGAALVRYWWQEINGNEGEPPMARFEKATSIRDVRSIGTLPDPVPVTLRSVQPTNDGCISRPCGPALLIRAWGEREFPWRVPFSFRVRYELRDERDR